LYGCELWKLGSPEIEAVAVGVSWRKALKRVWGFPGRTQSDILYAVCGRWPIEDEICRRSIRFVSSCLRSDCNIVNFVVKFGLHNGPILSNICSTVMLCTPVPSINLI